MGDGRWGLDVGVRLVIQRDVGHWRTLRSDGDQLRNLGMERYVSKHTGRSVHYCALYLVNDVPLPVDI